MHLLYFYPSPTLQELAEVLSGELLVGCWERLRLKIEVLEAAPGSTCGSTPGSTGPAQL